MNHALQRDHVANLGQEADGLGDLFPSEDAQKGLPAFIEKREPKYKGK